MGSNVMDKERASKANMRVNLALLSGLSAANAERGEVIVMDVHDRLVVGIATLKKRHGESGFVFRTSRVKEVNSMFIETCDTMEYIRDDESNLLPLTMMLPVVSYLALLEFGAQPSDQVNWPGGTTSVEDLFLQRQYWPLTEAAVDFIPDGMEMMNAMLSRLGFLLTPETPQTPEKLRDMEIYPLQVLGWISDWAQGKGLSKVFRPNPDSPFEPRQSILMLQQLLQRSGVQVMNEAEGDAQTPVCGFSDVSIPDEEHSRQITFCGYFPADKPKYSIMVRLAQENLPDDLNGENSQELGAHAASVCKNLVDFYMDL